MNIQSPYESYWNETVARTGLDHERTADEFARIIRAYEEPHRHYHTPRHLTEMFNSFTRYERVATNIPSVLWAIWFHDAVYDPRATDNEERSADWARQTLTAWGVHVPLVERTFALVLETKHEGERPRDPDSALFLDTDLSILGSEPDRYDEYALAIRAEYGHVPDALYRAGRSDFLRRFLLRPRIYFTDAIYRERETSARSNLLREIDRLSK